LLEQIKTGPLFIVVSGPSGVGKDAVLNRLKALKYPFHYTVTATTRARRATEEDGRDYHFYTEPDFKRMVASGDMVEWALVYGNYYGTPKQEVVVPLRAGQDVIVRVDTQGAASIKKAFPEAVFIFLMPPSVEELSRRLKLRKSESAADLKKRLDTVPAEIATLPMFDYLVVNHQDRLDETIKKVEAIVSAEKCRVKPRKLSL
jgi:guanylate kinase